jgi:hypothetical protein
MRPAISDFNHRQKPPNRLQFAPNILPNLARQTRRRHQGHRNLAADIKPRWKPARQCETWSIIDFEPIAALDGFLVHAQLTSLLKIKVKPFYNGILSCFFHGFFSCLPRRDAKALETRLRVDLG